MQQPIRIIEKVDLGAGFSVNVKELTLAEIRAWLLEGERDKQGSNDTQAVIYANVLFNSDMNIYDMFRMSDLTQEMAENLTHSQAVKIAEVCKRLNAPFFVMLAIREKETAIAQTLESASK